MRQSTERQVRKHSLAAISCDACGKRENVPEGEEVSLYSWVPEGWLSFSSSHNDWEGDSPSNTHDVCSWACYLQVVRRLFKGYELPWYGGAPGVPRRQIPTLQVDGKDWYFLKQMVDEDKS